MSDDLRADIAWAAVILFAVFCLALGAMFLERPGWKRQGLLGDHGPAERRRWSFSWPVFRW